MSNVTNAFKQLESCVYQSYNGYNEAVSTPRQYKSLRFSLRLRQLVNAKLQLCLHQFWVIGEAWRWMVFVVCGWGNQCESWDKGEEKHREPKEEIRVTMYQRSWAPPCRSHRERERWRGRKWLVLRLRNRCHRGNTRHDPKTNSQDMLFSFIFHWFIYLLHSLVRTSSSQASACSN